MSPVSRARASLVIIAALFSVKQPNLHNFIVRKTLSDAFRVSDRLVHSKTTITAINCLNAFLLQYGQEVLTKVVLLLSENKALDCATSRCLFYTSNKKVCCDIVCICRVPVKDREVKVNIFDMAGHPIFYEAS